MNRPKSQQIVISGVGGQGVLFVTRLLAEAAINQNLPVLTSETHGMAQRGGTVLSHLKIGKFTSPLIRPFTADSLLALKEENLTQHGFYLKKNGWTVVNSSHKETVEKPVQKNFEVNAEKIAESIGNKRAVNLVLLGFSIAVSSKNKNPGVKLFCTIDDIKEVLSDRLSGKKELLEASLKAIESGYGFYK